jgi:hypothetical protein
MRYLLIFLMLMMLSACGGGETTPEPIVDIPPTSFVPEGTQVGVVDVAPENITGVETLIAEEISAQNPQPFAPTLLPVEEEGALPVPLAGTLVASETEDPQAGLAFDYIYLLQEGGSNNERIVSEIYGDGRTTFNAREGKIGQDALIEIIRAIDELNYFGIQGTFLGPAPRPNEYTYTIVVQRGANSRRINAQDGYIPMEVMQFMAQIRTIAESAPALAPTSTPTS